MNKIEKLVFGTLVDALQKMTRKEQMELLKAIMQETKKRNDQEKLSLKKQKEIALKQLRDLGEHINHAIAISNMK